MAHQVAVITGASAGVGRATARELARCGLRIALLSRESQRLQEVEHELRNIGAEVIALPCDVADADRVAQCAEVTEQRLGPIDIWINNAMVSVFSPVRLMKPEEYRRVTEVTYLGGVYGVLAALRRMLPRDHGTIVTVGSALAYRGIPLQSAYCAAKHALKGFYDSLRTELKHDGSNVRLSMVHLPAINTPQFDWVKSRLPHRAQPVPPIYQPEVAARAIAHAALHPRRELWVGYPTWRAIIGNRIAPWYADRYLAKRGFAWQQTAQPEDPSRPNNLWEPVEGPYGAHGRFDERATSRSPLTWVSMHRRWVLGVGLATFTGAAAAVAMSRMRQAAAEDAELWRIFENPIGGGDEYAPQFYRAEQRLSST